jgi:hypothetical protein
MPSHPSIYLFPDELSISQLPTQGSEGSGVHKIVDGLDLVGRQVLDERELVNALDIECPSVRKLDMQKELQKRKKKKKKNLVSQGRARFTARGC